MVRFTRREDSGKNNMISRETELFAICDNKNSKSNNIISLISIISWVSFCETLLNEHKCPFPYITFRTLDVMLKIVAFPDVMYNSIQVLNLGSIVSFYNHAYNVLDQEETEFVEGLEKQFGSPEESILKAIIHLTNNQFNQIPDHSLFTNFLRLNYIIKHIIPKYHSNIVDRGCNPLYIIEVIDNIFGKQLVSVLKAVNDLTDNLLRIYKDTCIYSWLKQCTHEDEYKQVVFRVIDGILTHNESSLVFLKDVSRLLSEIGETYKLDHFISTLSHPITQYNQLAAEHFESIKLIRPDLLPSSYRYESCLRKQPILNNEGTLIIPNYYDFFTCLRELPIRFNECYSVSKSKLILDTMGHVYEFYLCELLLTTLPPDRFTIIPEFKYNRSGSEVSSPDFVIIDKKQHKVLIIEAKSTRITNVIRDDPDNQKSIDFAQRISDVLKKTLPKIDELFDLSGDYCKYKDEIECCTKGDVIVIYLLKDFGVLIPSLMHTLIRVMDSDLSDRMLQHHYCLMEIVSIENILHNFKGCSTEIYEELCEYHKLQVGASNTRRPVQEWIPINHKCKDLIYFKHLNNSDKEL